MKKLNNKILIIILAVLAVVFGLSRIFRASSREGNLRKEIVAIDTAAVTEIKIYSNTEKNKEVRLVREGKNWVVKMDNRSATAERGGVSRALGQFMNLKPLRLVSKKKNKWKEFNVSDTSTQVKFLKGIDVLADVRVGKNGFNQQPGGQQFSPRGVFTYVRLSNEDEVYSVEGFLEPTFNKSYNDWREKSFLRLKQNEITKVTFIYPSDSGFVIEKRDKKWWINDSEADSTKVKNFLTQLEYKNASKFADEFKAIGNAKAIIQFAGSAGTLATIQAWKRQDDWAMSSSHQSGIYFSSKGLESLLQRKKNFLPEKKR
jgi:hypothetical protein